MDNIRAFEIVDYRKNLRLGVIAYTNGVWEADNEVSESLLKVLKKSPRTDEEIILYLSSTTNQAVEMREVNLEE